MKRSDLEPWIGPLAWRQECQPLTATTWRIPAYGFLAGVELTLMEPLPNMDANALVELAASIEIDGTRIETGESMPKITTSSHAIVRSELCINGTPVRFGSCIARFHQVANPQ